MNSPSPSFSWSLQPLQKDVLASRKFSTAKDVKLSNQDEWKKIQATKRAIYPDAKLKTIKLPSNVSKPLEWSKRFGDNGRQVSFKIAKARVNGLEKALKPPAGQCIELIKIVDDILKAVLYSTFTEVAKISLYAKEYAETRAKGKNHSDGLGVNKLVKLVELALTKQDSTTVTSSEENSFTHLLTVLGSLPNHRSLDELVFYLLPILASITEESSQRLDQQINPVTGTLYGYWQHSRSIYDSLCVLTVLQTDRCASEPGKQEIAHKKNAEQTLRHWYYDHLKIFEKSKSSHHDNPSSNGKSIANYPRIFNSRKSLNGTFAAPLLTPTSPSTSTKASSTQPKRELNLASARFRPVSSAPVTPLSITACDLNSQLQWYRRESVSPSRIRVVTEPSTNSSRQVNDHDNDQEDSFSRGDIDSITDPTHMSALTTAQTPHTPRTSRPSRTSRRPTSASTPKTTKNEVNKVLVKVMEHKGLSSFVDAMIWSNPLNGSSDKSIGRITRCKKTDNSATTNEIFSSIGQLVDESLRVFGANILVEDILEEPAPPQKIVYQPTTKTHITVGHTRHLSDAPIGQADAESLRRKLDKIPYLFRRQHHSIPSKQARQSTRINTEKYDVESNEKEKVEDKDVEKKDIGVNEDYDNLTHADMISEKSVTCSQSTDTKSPFNDALSTMPQRTWHSNTNLSTYLDFRMQIMSTGTTPIATYHNSDDRFSSLKDRDVMESTMYQSIQPQFNPRQVDMLMAALVSDCARTVLVSK